LIGRVRSWLPVRVLAAYGSSQAAHYAAALAFSAMLAMFPLILGTLAGIGYLIRDAGTEARFESLILDVFPAGAQMQMIEALSGVKHSAGWMSLLSLAGILWTASGLFSTMEFAFTQIFGTKQRDMLRQKAMGFLMMVVLVVAVGFTVVANTLLALFPFAWVAGFLIGGVVMIGLLILLYRFVPNRTFTVREVLPGAVLSGTLIEVFSLGFPIYARFSGGFSTYGAQFGLFFLLAAWFYLLSQLLLLGSVYNRMRLGEPDSLGVIASPMHKSRDAVKPVEAIKDEQKRSWFRRRRRPRAT
jgi:membrane protein